MSGGQWDGLRVDHAALDAAAADLAATVRAMDARLDRLAAELAPLRTGWSGAQQEAYRAAQATWDAAMAQMRDLLALTGRAVEQANDAYRAADLRGAARFG
ncbi:WXG100 family type VII secretion target [Nocardioides sp. GY 10113]|uniref:WXG100 family type VII secretion target n=1 Tax=Nocardioides sp. GY 10113 TaxID=2569761 RepID=UPI0010A76706|nr:WXG100 family type VII secretion target [Nocardioides sp. GY 10113]TIC89167.1 WXG100 family type VII secretion target [Nocardioides sp. GY 10113]